ncbi:MAG: hypothetical protein GWO16_04930 [Gammaproteobacteria bacterium]|nr:hypothetical protein [Gammaproteobacteria bacterium]
MPQELLSVQRLSARAARTAASLFNYGTIAAVLVPVPLGLLWLCASMAVYAMNRRHPEPRVGHYAQQAAYRLYAVAGGFVALATFFPGQQWSYYLYAWIAAAAMLVPWSVIDPVRIRREQWCDLELIPQAGEAA